MNGPPSTQAFYFCSQAGCKKKYKTERGWWKHMTQIHKAHGPVLPKPVIVISEPKRKRKAQPVSKKKKRAPAKKRKKKNAVGECSICMDAGCDAAVIPCGHSSFCGNCLQKVRLASADPKCPSCRAPLQGILKLYR